MVSEVVAVCSSSAYVYRGKNGPTLRVPTACRSGTVSTMSTENGLSAPVPVM